MRRWLKKNVSNGLAAKAVAMVSLARSNCMLFYPSEVHASLDNHSTLSPSYKFNNIIPKYIKNLPPGQHRQKDIYPGDVIRLNLDPTLFSAGINK